MGTEKGPIMEYELKQQTPMIHFQYDEPGACLRATEFKPKFDRYLIKKYGEDKVKQWFKGDHKALDYKVKIVANGQAKRSDSIGQKKGLDELKRNGQGRDQEAKKRIEREHPGIHEMYFGNMSQNGTPIEEAYKETVYYKDGIMLTIVCVHKGLRELIDASIVEFLSLTNFGTRQSKGFGGFSLASGKDTLELLNRMENPICPAFFYTKTGKNNLNDNMNIAAAIYAAMKGGMNRSRKKGDGKYIKGYIQMQYLHDIGESKKKSDKAFIKAEGFFDGTNAESKSEYLFVRALLGLGDHVEFKDPHPDENGVQRIGKVEIKSKEVARYQSPVTIKIVDDYIFFIFWDTFKYIKGKEFIVAGKPDNKAKNTETVKSVSGEISVPEVFDINQFIDGFVEYYEKKKEAFKKIGYRYEAAATVTLKKGGK